MGEDNIGIDAGVGAEFVCGEEVVFFLFEMGAYFLVQVEGVAIGFARKELYILWINDDTGGGRPFFPILGIRIFGSR